MMRDHGFTVRDYCEGFHQAGAEGQCGIGLSRLCSGTPQRDDEGYAHLLANPPTLEQMTSFFVAQREALEVEAAAAARRRRGPDKQPG